MFSSSECLGYSNAGGLKYTIRCNRLLGLQEFQFTRTATHKHTRAHTRTHARTHTHTHTHTHTVREIGIDTERQLARSVVNGGTFSAHVTCPECNFDSSRSTNLCTLRCHDFLKCAALFCCLNELHEGR